MPVIFVISGAMSGKPGRSGRKSFVATPEQRNNVKILVGLGVPQAMICQLVVNPQTGKPLDEGPLEKRRLVTAHVDSGPSYQRAVRTLLKLIMRHFRQDQW